MHAVERVGLQHVVEHLDRVVCADADVGQLLFADALEQRADARLVHFAAKEVGLGHQGRDRRGGFAHAEADFQHRRRGATEHSGEVDGMFGVRQQKQRAEFGKGAGLALGGAASAAHEAFQASVQGMRRVGRRHFAAWWSRIGRTGWINRIGRVRRVLRGVGEMGHHGGGL